jgi:hypothetical protein
MSITVTDKTLIVRKNTFINPFQPPAPDFEEVARSGIGAFAILLLARPFAQVTLYTHRVGFLRRPLHTFVFLRLFAWRTHYLMDEAGTKTRLTPKMFRRRLCAFLSDLIHRKPLRRKYQDEVIAALRP